MRTVLLFGTFDILHPGHRALFAQARRYGARIVVILARDRTVKELKRHAPCAPERTRKRNLLASGLADEVVLGSLADKYKDIQRIAPEVICLGYDQTAFVDKLADHLKKFNLRTRIVRLKPFKPHIYKTSLLHAYARHKIHPRASGRNKTK